ncbi:hypothetical protein CF335_g7992, partial [Tilletia laevis]
TRSKRGRYAIFKTAIFIAHNTVDSIESIVPPNANIFAALTDHTQPSARLGRHPLVLHAELDVTIYCDGQRPWSLPSSSVCQPTAPLERFTNTPVPVRPLCGTGRCELHHR